MAKEYRKSPMLKFFFRKIMGLAFLPENEVLTCILSLLRDPQTIFLLQQNPKIADFLKYFHRTWILTFDVSTWNTLDREPVLRTTNGCEAWNSTWNRHTNRSSPNLWLAIKFLKQQQKTLKTLWKIRERSKTCVAKAKISCP